LRFSCLGSSLGCILELKEKRESWWISLLVGTHDNHSLQLKDLGEQVRPQAGGSASVADGLSQPC
ncbi:hypothetical protein T4B_354, partial [Trichinella pseudospiralis]